MHHHKQFIAHISPAHWVASALFIGIVGVLGYGAYFGLERFAALSEEVATLRGELASTTALLQESIAETHSSLSSALTAEKENVSSLQEKLGSFEQEVGTISGTVNTLEKLSRTDPELLQKYSRVFFLNEHYTPERVVEIPKEFNYYEDRIYQIHAAVWPYLSALLNGAKAGGIELYVYSGYRSFDEQSALKGQYTVVYGAGTANQFSADQGYSEHQLGTTVDLITTGIGGTLSGFENTPAYVWLKENAYRFGFILSYPEKNGHYVFEPWHWRFVGVPLATELYNSGRSFYDLEQREIDQYLVSIFD